MSIHGLFVTPTLSPSLECPICLEYFSPPVRQCSNGHSICSQCYKKSGKICPECRSEIRDNFRNIIVEKLLESLQIICGFPGCDTNLLLSNRLKHEENCIFNPNIECVMPQCEWYGPDLCNHLKTVHSIKEFNMRRDGGIRGWNSKTWQNADWGFSIWNFDGKIILNQSQSTGELFFLWVYDLGDKRHNLRLSVGKNIQQVSFKIQTSNIRKHGSGFPFHLATRLIEKHFLEAADELEEGYQRLSIKVQLLS